ncbi:DUF4268 domain-containing protein [Candidatus Poribacteria bacterium]|nr:DUF4268 domain-containing protein [Candidatus Poribacteria bacterium]
MELKEHIDDIRSRLKQKLFLNETAVRQGIVDRLLNALGWQTFDTQRVYPEYPINGGRVDYALCHPPGKPLVFIEVKRVGNIEGAEKQLFEYAFHEGVPILILTDGQKWRFFHPAGSGSYQERLVRELDLIADGNEESSKCLLKYLMYTAVQAGIAGQVIAEDYQEILQHREVRRHLPEAWENLLSGTSGDSEFLIEAVQSETHRLCGNRPTYKQVLAFLDDFRKKSETEPKKTSERRKTQPQPQADANDVPPQRPTPRPSNNSPRNERYRSYFQRLIDELREQHGFTNAHVGQAQNWYYFSSGVRGIYYEATFARNHKVYASLYIDFEDFAENKNFFDVLKERESEITAQFDIPLNWERRDETRYSAIRLIRDGDINADESELAAIKEWHIVYLLKLKAVFMPEIERARETLKSQ